MGPLSLAEDPCALCPLPVSRHAGSDLVLVRASVAPGKAVPLHSHPDAESVFVVSGSLDFCHEHKGVDHARFGASGLRCT
jgi:quercetin dioxygenase-like cupin family protein